MKKVVFIIMLMAGSLSCAFAMDTTTVNSKVSAANTLAITRAKLDSANAVKLAVLANKPQPTLAEKAAIVAIKCQDADWGILSGFGYGLILIIIILFWIIAVKTEMLRAPVMNQDSFMKAAWATAKYKHVTDINKIQKPYSLSRSQLGVWTIVIGCSYIFLELCKYYPIPVMTMDKTLLALMGMSAGTAAIGNIIDNNAEPDQQGVIGPSRGFFKDILSDQNGINIHRFQNVMWTAIAVVLYLCQVPDVACGHLPTLDTTLVALTGISNATYLGLKINENKPPASTPMSQNPTLPIGDPTVAPNS
ncbi:MAG: hypothetical protein JWQ79_3140 [Mucilaginibacter sp.]|nr:hypothetical protein [Mucilaginibacter sp.]